MTTPFDILLLNANTNRAMTDRLVASGRVLQPGIRGATVARGASYISDAASAAIAAAAALEFAENLTAEMRPEVLVISCFGDPGLMEIRSLLRIPVVGMAEASCHGACRVGQRFAIVTGGQAWGPMLQRFVSEIGLSGRLSGIHTLELTGDRIAKDREGARTEIGRQIEMAVTGGADSVILGGAGLIGFAKELQAAVRVPLLDSLNCAVTQAAALASLRRAASSES